MMEKFRSFMQGRYGNDLLNTFLILIGCIVTMLLSFLLPPQYNYLKSIGTLFYLVAVIRSFSKNIEKRRSENLKFMNFTKPWRIFIEKKIRQKQDTEHKYYNCPECHHTLRVPKGRGKINISCPHCGKQFKKKT